MTLWKKAEFVPSPNFNQRPETGYISLLVIHNISLPPEQFGGPYVRAFFLNQLNASAHPYFQTIAHLEVSAHFFINRQGETLQFVATDKRAWHAGVSEYMGRANCNDFSIGIELEGSDHQAYTDAQYRVLIELTQFLQAEYPLITSDRIVGHSDIASGRKTDPGPHFDWQRYKAALC